MNQFTAIGRLGSDAETRATPNGTTVASFPLAVDVGYGDNKRAMWIDCAIFGKRAESGLIQYLTKGKQVAVSGPIEDKVFDKRDGSQGFKIALSVNELDLIGGDDRQQPRQQPPSQQSQQAAGGMAPPPATGQAYGNGGGDFGSDDIPFAAVDGRCA